VEYQNSTNSNPNLAQVFGDTYQRTLNSYDQQAARLHEVTHAATGRVRVLFDRAQE
jgi:hypothetical protein